MDIFRQQMKRILGASFFLGLLAAFLAFDLYLISSRSNMRREINLINDVAGRTGVRIDAEFEEKFGPILKKHTTDLGDLFRQVTGGASGDTAVMLKQIAQRYYTLSGEQQGRFRDDSAILQLDGAIKGRNAYYEGYDITAAGKMWLKQGRVTGAPARFISRNCTELQSRMAQIKSDGEKDTLFFPGTVYGMHGFLYGTLFGAIIMESAVLGVLVMFFAVNFEFMHGTQNLAYTSRRGRHLPADQFRAAMLVGMFVPIFLIAAALSVFFANYHFSNVWDSFVSSGMNAEPHGMQVVPYITLRPMTTGEYLRANIGLVLVLQAVFCLLAFSVAIYCRNNYVGFLGYALGWMMSVNLPSVLPWNTVLPLILTANPVIAWVDCGNWLTQIDIFDASPWYFPAIFLLGASLAAIAAFFGVRRFRRADL